MLSAAEIRQGFIDFFVRHDHRFVPSAPVVPTDDPTLMFTNAGMNQFKDVFLGTGQRDYRRAANSQKCIRVSGKHNDLEEVGRDNYHHTFFEMLGNWSFGDYFKREAIQWAWELLTGVWKLPAERLYPTVFAGSPQEGVPPDDEAFEHWARIVGAARVQRFGKKDNFWEMGETGPCGPCSEIHVDLTPNGDGSKLVNAGRPEVIELWNLVFIEFNRSADGTLTALPAKHVDTGMGFERLVRVLQGAKGNYETDVFSALMKAIGERTGRQYTAAIGSAQDDAFRVVADHLRMLAFAIADGALPGNEGRGYVLRRILRRAACFARLHLGHDRPIVHQLVPVLVAVMREAYPELAASADRIAEVIADEEESFARTLDRGLQLFEQAAQRAKGHGKIVSGEEAFKLKDTYGFPIDLTMRLAEQRGLRVNEAGFEELSEDARRKAREAARKHVHIAFAGQLPRTDDSPKYAGRTAEARLLGWVKDNALIQTGRLASDVGEVGLVLDRTACYAEAGGQVGDGGAISSATGTFDLDDTQWMGDGILHIGHVADGHFEAGQTVQVAVDAERDHIRRNHTATHLLHWALRRVLGEHVTQRGSLVEPERLRFDFDHPSPVGPEALQQVERLVNEQIVADMPVEWRVLPKDKALALDGVRAFFGEKYGDDVRVVEIGEGLSRELCGGTHLDRTGQIGLFKIVGEEAVSKGVRRITAATGMGALRYVQQMDSTLAELSHRLKRPREQLVQGIEGLSEQIRRLQQEVRRGVAADLKSVRQTIFEQREAINGAQVMVAEVPMAPVEQLREAADWLRDRAGTAAVLLVANDCDERRVLVLAALTKDLVGRGLHAGKWVAEVAPLVGGRGGGKPDMAQAGGKDPASVPAALEAARAWIRSALGGPG